MAEEEEEQQTPLFPINLGKPGVKEKLQPYWERAPSEMEAVANDIGLEIGEEVELSHFVHMGKKTTRLGNRPTAKATLESYEGIWRQFWSFCAYIGDYQSMLILLLPPPAFVPPVKAETLELFLHYKYHPTNSPLKEGLTDVFGNRMLAEGGWNNPKKEWAFTAAMADLHEEHKWKGVMYEDVCPLCKSLGGPCSHHEQIDGRARLRRVGDPTKTTLYRNAKRRCQEQGKSHKETGSAALLPVDLRMLRTHLLSAPNIINLQTWTINLMATLLFFRYDEFHRVHGDHFLPELFKIPRSTETVESLALKVRGKADDNWVELCMFADHEYPGLCGVRFLLVYLYLIKWKGGYIFPHEKELSDPPADGVYTTTIEYSPFLHHMQDVCKRVLIKRKNKKIGCHTWRKTACTLAIFGKGVRDDIKISARHSLRSTNAATYSRDAERSYEDHLRTPNPLNNVREWKCIRISSTDHSGVMSTLAGSRYVTMKDLPEFFVHEILKVERNNPNRNDMHYLLNRAANYVTSDGPEKELAGLLGEMHPRKAAQLRKVIDNVVVSRVRSVIQVSRETKKSLVTANLPVPILDHPTAPVVTPQPKRRKVAGNNDLDGRHSLNKRMSTQEKLSIMLEVNEKRNEGKLTSGAKTWASRSLDPTINCLNNHFGGDKDAFAQKYPKYLPTKFKDECCNGLGDTCST